MGGTFYLFSAAGIPVYIQPLSLLILLYTIQRAETPQQGIVWAVCLVFSVFVHEMGHGLVARFFKLGPEIVLHGWGGFTRHGRAARDRDDALIVAAGPSAGLLLGGIVFLAGLALELFRPDLLEAFPLIGVAINSLLFVNFFWSFVNLLPMFPLDGGLLFRLGMYKVLKPRTAERVVHGVGLALAVGWMAVGGILLQSGFMVIMGALYAWQNFQVLSGTKAAPKARVPPPHIVALREEAHAAFDTGDFREAVRLCHVLRSEAALPAPVREDTMALLVRGLEALGDYAEALSWARYAPVNGPVVEARINALVGLGRTEEAKALLAEHGGLLNPTARAAVSRKLD